MVVVYNSMVRSRLTKSVQFASVFILVSEAPSEMLMLDATTFGWGPVLVVDELRSLVRAGADLRAHERHAG